MICFATYGDSKFEKSRDRLASQANDTGWFDKVTVYSNTDLNDEFVSKYSSILKQKRGGGYWIWKFNVIEQELSKMKNGDILIYLDAGCTINAKAKRRFDQYVSMLNSHSTVSFQLDVEEKKYTTTQIFEAFNISLTSNHAKSGQFVGGILIMKKCDNLQKKIEKCLSILSDNPNLITDMYNDVNQHDFFIDNRHDQSILSLSRKQSDDNCILKDETYFLNFGRGRSIRFPFWATRIRC